MPRKMQEKLRYRDLIIQYYWQVCYSLDIWENDKYYFIDVVLDKSYNKYGNYVGLCDHNRKTITIYLGENDLDDIKYVVRHEARHVWQRWNWSRKMRYYDNTLKYEEQKQEIDAYNYADTAFI